MNSFEYKSTVTIGDTNVMKNMYFLNFFKLQGIARELWVKSAVDGGGRRFSTGDAAYYEGCTL